MVIYVNVHGHLPVVVHNIIDHNLTHPLQICSPSLTSPHHPSVTPVYPNSDSEDPF
ncbi:hypothetical protein Csa_018402, partial [Cucumis sativus]